MKRLGAILAGGASRRFGSDKALALVEGQPMLARVAAALALQCDMVVVVGRDWPGLSRIEDRPRAGLGPLGGLCGALLHAAGCGFTTVLTAGCDLPFLPDDMSGLLGEADAVLADQPTVGLWRAGRGPALLEWMDTTPRHAIRAWVEAIGARQVAGPALPNVNTPEDLANLGPR